MNWGARTVNEASPGYSYVFASQTVDIPLATGEYEWVFSDEFNTESAVDPAKWKPIIPSTSTRTPHSRCGAGIL
jgi:hypothetical protein